MRTTRRLDGTVRTTIHVPFPLTAEQLAVAMVLSGRYPADRQLTVAQGLELIRWALRRDSAAVRAAAADPQWREHNADRLAAALRDIRGWHLG